MIACLRGRVQYRDLTWVILDVQGVGYQVLVPSHIDAVLGTEVTLYTSHQIREESMNLYGFKTLAERTLFELLLSVSGVGPKSALAIIGIGSVERIQAAIAQGETALFEAVSGIGKKAAAKIIVELKNKVTGLRGDLLPTDQTSGADLVTALEGLGYRRLEILPILVELPADVGELNGQLRWALKRLSRPGRDE